MTLRASLQAGLLNQSSAQVIEGSLRFDANNTNYLKRTFSSGNRTTWTLSVWVKRNTLAATHTDQTIFEANGSQNDNDNIKIKFRNATVSDSFNISGWNTNFIITNQQFRDVSSWYNLVVSANTGEASADRLKVYVNGERITSFNTYSAPSGNTGPNGAVAHHIGHGVADDQPADMNMSQYYFIDGLQLGPENFGFTDPLTNTWRPKKYTGVFNAPESGFGGTVWSTFVSNGSSGGTAPSKAFNGDIANNSGYSETNWTRSASNGDTPATFDVSSVASMANVTEVKVYVYVLDSGNDNTILAVNGSNITTGGASGFQVYTVDVTGSGLDTIKYKYKNGNGPYCYLTGVTVSISGGSHQELIDGSGAAAGVNGFYLPMDGNSPIGQDKSGNGNDWTPVNFGGSVELDNPQVSGARPILNTTQGGTAAGVDVFGSKEGFYETVSSSSGGGNPYIFDGRGTQPTLSFIRGATYVFDYSSATSHPLRFATAADAAGSTQYTDGTSVSGNVISFTVPHNAPDTLYYYCTNHSGMGNSISVTTDETKADPYAWKCVLAMPLVGSNIDVCDKINCTTTAKTLAVQADAAASIGGSNWYGGSFYFDGSGDYLGATSHADFAMGTGDFTLECWVNRSSSGAFQNFMATRGAPGSANGYTFGAQSSGNGYDVEFYTDGLKLDGGDQDIRDDNWYHVAVTRTGTTLSSYVNGVLNTTATNSQNFSNTSLAIGMTNDGNQGPFNGYIQDVRIYKGVAKYSGGSVGDQVFVVPATNPDILPDSPSGVSGSSKLAKITDGAVSFDGNGDYLSLADSSDFDLAGNNWTIEAFVYHSSTNYASYEAIVGQWVDTSGSDRSWIFEAVGSGSTSDLEFYYYDTSNNFVGPVQGGTLSKNRWHHVAACRSGNTIRMFIDGVMHGSGTSISVNIKNSTNNVNVGGNIAGAGYWNGFISNVRVINNTALYTANFTPPTEPLTNVTNTKLLCCTSPTSGNLAAVSPATFSNDGTVWSSGVTFSPSVLNADRGADKAFNGTISNNASTTSNNPALLTASFSTNLTSVTSLRIYSGSNSSNAYINGASGSTVSITANNWTDLTSLASGASGTISSISVVTAGDNAQLAAVEVNGCILVDGLVGEALLRVGDAAATNFNPFNTNINTVRGQETGYATWNPLKMGGSDVSMSEGNLFWRTTSNGPDKCTHSTIGMDSGKFYWENEIVEATATAVGIANVFANDNGGPALAHNWMYYSATGQTYIDGSASSYGDAYNTNGTIIGVAFDRDNLTLEFYKNGVSQGKLTSISGLTDSETYFAMCGDSGGASQSQVRVNFGQKPFKFPPPDGFQPLNGANVLPETVIARSNQYFGNISYSGTSASTATVTSENIKFTPDFVWCKSTSNSEGHALYDSVRGGENILRSNTNEENVVNANNLKTFIPGGFTTGNNGHVYYNGYNYASWMWKAGGNKGTFNKDDVGYASASAAGITDGTIALTGCSVGTKNGFSILKYAGSGSNGTIAHGLSQAPDFFFGRDLDDTSDSRDWIVYHKTMGNTGRLKFVGNASISESSTFFQNTSPTNSLISVGTSNDINSTNDYILYCFHNVPGLQKFGGYTGNGSDDGPFVETGFRPALIWTRAYSSNSNNNSHWLIYDTLVNTHNESSEVLYINLANGVNSHSSMGIDILSNGFKLKADSSGYSNYNGWSYVYCAWAEAPAFNLYGAQSNAR